MTLIVSGMVYWERKKYLLITSLFTPQLVVTQTPSESPKYSIRGLAENDIVCGSMVQVTTAIDNHINPTADVDDLLKQQKQELVNKIERCAQYILQNITNETLIQGNVMTTNELQSVAYCNKV